MRSEQRLERWHYKDWPTFEKEFEELFCTKNEQLAALTKLEGTSWYQGKDSVEDYIDRFLELIDLAEYSDDKTIVIKFRKGLDPIVQSTVATLGKNAPDIDEPKKWFEAARKVSRNRDANEAFLETSWSSVKASPRTSLPTPRLAMPPNRLFALPTRPLEARPRISPAPNPVTPKDGSTPMEVDRARPKIDHLVVCHCCHRASHYASESPRGYDIQTMMVEEKLELLPELLALTDAPDVRHTESEPEAKGDPLPENEAREDFGNSSG